MYFIYTTAARISTTSAFRPSLPAELLFSQSFNNFTLRLITPPGAIGNPLNFFHNFIVTTTCILSYISFGESEESSCHCCLVCHLCLYLFHYRFAPTLPHFYTTLFAQTVFLLLLSSAPRFFLVPFLAQHATEVFEQVEITFVENARKIPSIFPKSIPISFFNLFPSFVLISLAVEGTSLRSLLSRQSN